MKINKILSTIAVCATGIYLATCPVPSGVFAAENATLRIGTWNIDAKDHPDIPQMLAIFHEKNIDAVGCQEIDILNTRNNYDMMKAFVIDAYPYVHFGKGRDFANGYFGVGVVSQHKLLEQSSIPIESTGSRATKALERVVFEKDGKKIALYNTHLSWENLDLRRRQIKEVIDRINADPIEYKIVTADFNTDQHDDEYAMFLENFNIANGHNGKWFRTYGKNDDPAMKVFTIDNIIATKNMKVKHVEAVKTTLSDHYLLVADFELLNHVEDAPNENNIALGQAVTVSSANAEPSPYLLINYDKKVSWTSDLKQKQEIVIELDRLYQVDKAIVNWGDVRALDYRISVSVDGKNYVPLTQVKNDKNTEDKVTIAKTAKFIKFNLNEKYDANKPYEIKEIEVFGTKVADTASDVNLLKNGDMESVTNNVLLDWNLNVTKESAPTVKYALTADATEKYAGKYAAKLTRNEASVKDVKGDGSLTQTISLQPNKRYQLSFWHKTDTIDSGAFAYEINQTNANGEKIATHYAKLTDNLNMSKEWKQFKYNFITSAATENATIALHVLKGEGSLWIDNLTVKEVIPTEAILLKAQKTQLSVGEKTKVSVKKNPQNATDLELQWVSSDNKVATVDANGKVMAIGTGKAYIGLRSTSDLVAESEILIEVKE